MHKTNKDISAVVRISDLVLLQLVHPESLFINVIAWRLNCKQFNFIITPLEHQDN
jgi:hypothetical protein